MDILLQRNLRVMTKQQYLNGSSSFGNPDYIGLEIRFHQPNQEYTSTQATFHSQGILLSSNEKCEVII